MTVLLLTMLAVLSMQAQREVYHSSVPEFTLTVPEGGGDGRCVVTNEKSVYNLSGQRVANPTKGLYIVNGKKVIIK